MNKNIKNILVPTDLTEYSISILEVAISIAKKNNAQVLVAYILDSSSLMNDIENPFDESGSLNSLEERCQKKLNKLKFSIAEKYHFIIDVIVRKGLVASSIVGIARETDADLIVMGTHGTGARTFLLGLNAHFIVKQSTCSILTIPDGREYGAFTKILFPIRSMNDVLEKYDFLRKIVRKKDVVIEIPELIKNDSRINISVLNETIIFLGNKLLEENSKSPDEFQKIVNNMNEKAGNLKIKLSTIEENDSAVTENSFSTPTQEQLENYFKVPVFSISH
jgi:nucleotide-binding universal stress UspA family protein